MLEALRGTMNLYAPPARNLYQSHSRSSLPARRPPRALTFFFLLIFLFLLFVFPANILAQDTATNAAADEDVIRVRTDLIVVPFSVADKNKRRIRGLTQSDFQVQDNNRSVATQYFAAGTSRVALLFALDTSGSARAYAARQSDAALNLFSRFGKNSGIAVLRFNDKPELTVPFTSDTSNVRAAFDFPTQANRHTAIFDAALAAVRAFDTRAVDLTTRRIVILMSDGLDTASHTNPATVINEAQRLGVSFYIIHFPLFTPRDGTLQPRPPAKGFRELATQTGGNYFRAGNADTALDPRATYDLAPVFRSIEEDLASQYVLGYYATEATRDEGLHRIEVELNNRDRRKFRVRLLRESYVLNH